MKSVKSKIVIGILSLAVVFGLFKFVALLRPYIIASLMLCVVGVFMWGLGDLLTKIFDGDNS